MRPSLPFMLTLGAILGFALSATAADEPKLQLSDDGLPLQEIRPNDRRDYVLTLEGKWSKPALVGVDYYVNLLFPDGGSYAHKVLSDRMFALGEVRVLLPEYQLVRHGVARDGNITVVVSARHPANSTTAEDVVSDSFEVKWPLNRPVVLRPVRTKHAAPPVVDAFPLPDEGRPIEPVGPPRGTKPIVPK